MATCDIAINIIDASESAVEGAVIEAYIYQNVESGTSLITQRSVEAVTDASGNATLTLQQGLQDVKVRVISPNGAAGTIATEYNIDVPAAASANLTDLI